MNQPYTQLRGDYGSPDPYFEEDRYFQHHPSPETSDYPQQPDLIPLVQQTSRPGPGRFTSLQRAYADRRASEPSPSLTQYSPDLSNVGSTTTISPFIKRKPVVPPQPSGGRLGKIWSREYHKPVYDSRRPYAKNYSFRRTRDKLFSSCFTQWLITATLAGAIAGTLVGYQTMTTINNNQKHVFNALITGLSILLGANLASSLRSYADLIRWRLLASSWLSVQEFDLVLGCANLTKVLELLVTTRSRRRFPFISVIQFFCLLWLFVNFAAQVLVAMIGLTYSLDTANQNIFVPGSVKIANLSVITDIHGRNSTDPSSQEYSAHAFGIQGQAYSVVVDDDPVAASIDRYQTIFMDTNNSFALYRFVDYSPVDPTAYSTSERIVLASAECYAYTVYNWTYAYTLNSTNDNVLPGGYFDYIDIYNQTQNLYVRDYAWGAMTWISDITGECGDRCAHVYGLQYEDFSSTSINDPVAIDRSTIFDCNNTISFITNMTAEGEQYALGNESAQAIAGAIGWEGWVVPIGNNSYEHLEYQEYSVESYWSPNYIPTANGPGSAAMFLQQFSIGALAAMDNSPGKVLITDGQRPVRALIVTVEWHWTIPLLASIVTMQFVALVLVILWANKAVIKDDSFLAVAKLLAPLVSKLNDTSGGGGSVLRGNEIAFYIEERYGSPRNPYEIFYGPRQVQDEEDGAGSVVYRADILERGTGAIPNAKGRSFQDGKYD